ncbi:MAG: hypothetical protein R3A49_00325 [Acidimicrobiia bacterium]
MGQQITVQARRGSSPEIRIFDLNRSLTGMKIERYASADDVRGRRPPDVLAGRLFELGADSVSVYSNALTVEAPASRWADLEPRVVDTVENLFGYYGDDAGWSPEALGTATSGDPALSDAADDAERPDGD